MTDFSKELNSKYKEKKMQYVEEEYVFDKKRYLIYDNSDEESIFVSRHATREEAEIACKSYLSNREVGSSVEITYDLEGTEP